MVRNDITYHKRVRAANSALSIMRYFYVLATILESTYCVFLDRDKYCLYGFSPYPKNGYFLGFTGSICVCVYMYIYICIYICIYIYTHTH